MSRSAPRRGDIWWTDFGGDYGTRPGVIVTSDKLLPHLTNVTLIVVTTRIRSLYTEVLLPATEHALDEDSAANCSNILTVPKSRLMEFISHADLDTMNAIATAIHEALDLEW